MGVASSSGGLSVELGAPRRGGLLSDNLEVMDSQGDVRFKMRDLHSVASAGSVKIPSKIVRLRIKEEGAGFARGRRVRVSNEVGARHKLLARD
jgi:hypothetical protein